jgi:uncharacterized protein YbjT (DUF2867 family)
MILVTGATGQNGRAVVREFASRGRPVRALVRDVDRAGDLREMHGVEVVEGDLLRPQTLAPALHGVERALMISSSDSTMVEAQGTFIDAARSSGVRHIIKFSGLESGIGFDQRNFRFTRNHQLIERYLEASGVAWTHLRPNQFMQVYLRESRSIAANGVLALPAGQIRMAPVDVLDIAQIAFHLLTSDGHEGRRYAVTGPQALTMTEIAATISQAIGKPVTYVSITPEEKRDALLREGVPGDIAEALYEQAVERLKHADTHLALDVHKAFDIQPTTFAEFARRHADAFN